MNTHDAILEAKLKVIDGTHRFTANKSALLIIDMQHGFEEIPKTLTRLFTGKNLGKQLLKVTDPPLPIRSNVIEVAVFRVLSAYMVWRKGYSP